MQQLKSATRPRFARTLRIQKLSINLALFLMLTTSLATAEPTPDTAPSQEPSPHPLLVEQPEQEQEPEPALQATPDHSPAVSQLIQSEEQAPEERVLDGSVTAPTLEDVIEIDAPPPVESKLQVELQPEYRLRSLRITPIELNSEGVRDIHWTEQRFRLNSALVRPGIGAITIQLDALNGVLVGDNGSFIGDPASNSGVSLTSKRPNLTRWELGLKPGGDPLDRQSYVPVLREASMLDLNYIYGDITLPFGLLRVGRQPMNYGETITAHDGGRLNRWGVSSYSDGVDRILFGTKLDQAWGVIKNGKEHVLDSSQDNGVILGLFYDFLKEDDVALFSDDLRQFGVQLQLRKREADWFGLDWQKTALLLSAVHLQNDKFDSSIYGFPLAFETRVENFGLRAQYMHIRGTTREISEGFAALSGKEATEQELISHGAQVMADLDLGPVNLMLEFDYATGDDNPRPNDPITSFNFARDMNVGLLLFEHILAFESARSVAVGIENLSGADVASFPLTEASSEGRLTNAIVIFPQVKVDWIRKPDHGFHTRFGAMAAWSAAKLGVVDPIITSINDVTSDIADNAVNFHGGRPGRYYGTELDVQLQYRFKDNFFWTVEGAVLFPGDGLWNEHGKAVRSFLVENRLEYIF